MTPVLIAGALIGVPLALWFGVLGLVLVAARPKMPPAAPATEDLGSEPPAIVSFVVNHWEITEDAAESTLLDLAARHILELRQPGNDPIQTTVHVKASQPVGLLSYEQRVFDRVAGLAVGDTVPLTALTFRDSAQAAAWAKRFTADVVTDARARGLSRRRISKAAVSALSFGAAIVAAFVAIGSYYWLHHTHDDDPIRPALGAAIVAFAVLGAFAGKPRGERDTAAGRDVATRWLGVRAWLRGHDAFGDLPPAAVAVWDRYLSYGAAVGATRVSSAVIDLGMGNRRNVWSSFGGTWHRVRVHYPRFWPRYGKTAPKLIWRAIVLGAIGFALLHFWYEGIGDAFALPALRANKSFAYVALIKSAGVVAGLALIALGVYILIRTVVDLAAPITITGEVVWTEAWRSSGDSQSNTVILHYLAVDDGSADTTRAWALPSSLRQGCRDGATVTMRARRWSRRVVSLSVTEPGPEQRLVAADMATAAATSAALMAADISLPGMGVPGQRHHQPAGGALGGLAATVAPLPAAGALLTPDEVSAAFGFPVTLDHDAAEHAAVEMTEFRGPDGKAVLTIVRSGGLIARMAMRGRHGQQLPGLGDEGVGGPGWIAARRGGGAIMLHLSGQAVRTVPPAALLALARTAVSRMPVTVA